MQNTALKQQILFISDVEKIIGRDRLTLRRWWQNGKFPKPVKLNDSALCWHYEVIDQWIIQNMRAGEAINIQRKETKAEVPTEVPHCRSATITTAGFRDVRLTSSNASNFMSTQ